MISGRSKCSGGRAICLPAKLPTYKATEATMSAHSPLDVRLNRQGNAAFAFIVVLAYAILLLSPSPLSSTSDLAVLVVLGILYALIGMYGLRIALRSGRLAPLLVYFAVQLGLVLVILLRSLSVGQLWLLPLPLISQAVIVLPRKWMLLVSALVLTVLMVPFAVFGNAEGTLSAGFSFFAAIVFVALFTQIAVNERNARAEVEQLAAQLSEANSKLRAYAVQAEDLAAMQERNRMARDIHDGIGHYLTVINVQLEAALAVMDNEPARSRAAIDKALTLTHQALADVRRSVAALRMAPTESRPLADAIMELVEENRSAGIITELAIQGQPRSLTPQADLTLYRAVQESLTNVRKHAHASRADLTLDYSNSATVRLVVADNGVGAQDPSVGFGLLGVQERVQALGGKTEMRTEPRQGFTIVVEVPA